MWLCRQPSAADDRGVLRRPQRGEVSAEVAAGVFYEERRALLAALLALLAAAAEGAEAGGGAARSAVQRWVGGLLGERQGARSALLARLLELIQARSRPGPPLGYSWPSAALTCR